MGATGTRGIAAACAAWLLLLAGAPVAAEDAAPATPPTYKCVSRGRVVYTQIPCAGGREVRPSGARHADKYKTPPQDRAKLARRGQLSPQARQECESLEGRIREQEAQLKAKGSAPTIQDETPLVKAKLRFRELKC